MVLMLSLDFSEAPQVKWSSPWAICLRDDYSYGFLGIDSVGSTLYAGAT